MAPKGLAAIGPNDAHITKEWSSGSSETVDLCQNNDDMASDHEEWLTSVRSGKTVARASRQLFSSHKSGGSGSSGNRSDLSKTLYSEVEEEEGSGVGVER